MDILSEAIADSTILHLKGADGQLLYDGPDRKPVRVRLHSPGSDA